MMINHRQNTTDLGQVAYLHAARAGLGSAVNSAMGKINFDITLFAAPGPPYTIHTDGAGM